MFSPGIREQDGLARIYDGGTERGTEGGTDDQTGDGSFKERIEKLKTKEKNKFQYSE